ncbi:MAG TPA: SDR family NAD(P)-dependent oxidoreductase [Anaerolineae bacterium]|nr:SDR family NAD(P)-dependent oxidoreductase [Anaerolineae bacterium]
MRIDGQLILVTGASSGIGAATARLLAQQGGRVLLLARRQAVLEEVAADIAAHGGAALAYPVDLADPQAIVRTATAIENEVGTPDVLINNAGAGRWLTIQETSAREAEQMMALPYLAAFNLTREFLPRMLSRGSGHIVNVTSVASRLVWPGAAAYTAARMALYGFNAALRTELRGSGINVTLALLGSVSSEYWAHNPGSADRLPQIAKRTPMLTTEQAAQAIVRGIEGNAREIVRPRLFRFIFLLNTLFPGNTERVLRSGWRPVDSTRRPYLVSPEN